MKKFISAFIALIMILSVFAVPAASGVSVVKKTMLQYTFLNLSFRKAADDSYKCEVRGNDDNTVKVEAYNDNEYYWLTVKTLKPTGAVKPKITITDSKDGSTIKCYEITVTPAKKVEMKDVRLNVKTSRLITIKNPYYEYKAYKLKYDRSILGVRQYLYNGSKAMYTFKGLKKGTTTVKALIGSKVYGSFKVTVGDFKATLKKSFKAQTLKYNKHMNSAYFYDGGSIDLADAVNFIHPDAVYTVKIQNPKIASAKKLTKKGELPERVLITSRKQGKTAVTVFEKRKGVRRKLGAINLTVKKVNDNEVFDANMMYDDNGIFYEFFISPGDKVNLKAIIVSNYINCRFTGSKFSSGEYKIDIKAAPADALSVDKSGVITCLGFGKRKGINKVKYTVTFADGSKASGSGSFDISDD